MHSKAIAVLAAVHLVSALPQSSSQPPSSPSLTSAVAAAAATALTKSPVSNVKGLVFDRIIQIYLETTDFDHVIAEPNCRPLLQNGHLLTNLYGVAEPSQPNYVAPASGDYFGDNSDSFLVVDKNVSTIVDLLEDKGIAWGNYNEGLPYSGFNGYKYDNPIEGPYERKHNLLIRFESIRTNPDRAAKVKNLTLFYEDVKRKTLPQWAFITPNLNNDGHNTDIAYSCNWTSSFVLPLLRNSYVNNNTLFYVTWQANGLNSTARNHVAGIFLGSALAPQLIRAQDSAYYNHYSELSSVQANWGLHTLGRWDVGANVWAFVAAKSGDVVRAWNAAKARGSFESYYWNQSYGGVFSSAVKTTHTYVKPNLHIGGGAYGSANKRTVLPAIVKLWSTVRGQLPDYYDDKIELPDALHPPRGFQVPIGLAPAPPMTTPITAYPYATATAAAKA